MGDSHSDPKYFAPTNRLKTKAFLLTAAAQGRPGKPNSAATDGKSWLRPGKPIAGEGPKNWLRTCKISKKAGNGECRANIRVRFFE
jgi:hypothetical protein